MVIDAAITLILVQASGRRAKKKSFCGELLRRDGVGRRIESCHLHGDRIHRG